MYYALIVGIKQVDPTSPHYNGWDGKDGCWGCELDADNIERIVRANGAAVVVKLLTTSATAGKIKACVREIALAAKAGDYVVFYHSGHGGQQPDTSGDEQDGKDETIICYDRPLVDDELMDLWLQFKPGVRIFMVSDTCNSGTMYRGHPLGHIISFINRKCSTCWRPFRVGSPPGVVKSGKPPAEIIHMGGCRDGFSSMGYEQGGAFTMALCNAMSSLTGLNYQQLFAAIKDRLTGVQVPTLSHYGGVSDAFRLSTPFTVPPTTTVEVPTEPEGDGTVEELFDWSWDDTDAESGNAIQTAIDVIRTLIAQLTSHTIDLDALSEQLEDFLKENG